MNKIIKNVRQFFYNASERIRIDWQEYRLYRISIYNVRRDNKAIRRAMNRAREKNLNDGRTYYILRDKLGGINEFNSSDLAYWSIRHRPAIVAKMDFLERLKRSYGIVTCNQNIQKQYDQIQLNKENSHE